MGWPVTVVTRVEPHGTGAPSPESFVYEERS